MKNKDITIAKNFGMNLAKIRCHFGFTQEELAFKCNMQRSYIGAIERGEKTINICTLFRLAEGLGVEPYKLLKYASE